MHCFKKNGLSILQLCRDTEYSMSDHVKVRGEYETRRYVLLRGLWVELGNVERQKSAMSGRSSTWQNSPFSRHIDPSKDLE
jgi:hypothetical protein